MGDAMELVTDRDRFNIRRLRWAELASLAHVGPVKLLVVDGAFLK